MATWTGLLEGQGETSFPGGPPFPQGARTIRCGKCNEPLFGLQRIKAAEHMIGDLVGDPGFKVWPTRPERDMSAPFICEKCGKEINAAELGYCFSFDIWKSNEMRSHAGGCGAFFLDEVGSPVLVSDHDRPGFLCQSCEPDIATDLIELAKKHKLNAVREGRIMSRSLRDKKANP